MGATSSEADLEGQTAGQGNDWSFPKPEVRLRMTGDSPISFIGSHSFTFTSTNSWLFNLGCLRMKG